LPPGRWVDFWNQTPHEGDQRVTVTTPLDRIPVFVRAGAVLPVRLAQDRKLGEAVELSGTATDLLVF
jgi:alpha-glucosidase (family GH31 glycosyl hydrolase)